MAEVGEKKLVGKRATTNTNNSVSFPCDNKSNFFRARNEFFHSRSVEISPS